MVRQNKHLYGIAVLQIFTPDECADIIKNALNNWTKKEGTVAHNSEQTEVNDLDLRNTTLFLPPKTEQKAVWCKKIADYILSFNNDKESYGFDIVGMVEAPAMLRYMAPDINPNKKAGKYDWHMDIGPQPIHSMRKLSYSILLNVGEYEGGELEFHIGPDAESPSQTLGSMILFPSYLIHRVRPITKGTRYTIVGWMHGDSFK
tara:strand:+ start:76 stop:684 length:609 start_codon:yes stop_codon:yes gene_type:complete